MAATRRALHFVFKVADRTSTAAFYRDVLGMKVRGYYVMLVDTNVAVSACLSNSLRY